MLNFRDYFVEHIIGQHTSKFQLIFQRLSVNWITEEVQIPFRLAPDLLLRQQFHDHEIMLIFPLHIQRVRNDVIHDERTLDSLKKHTNNHAHHSEYTLTRLESADIALSYRCECLHHLIIWILIQFESVTGYNYVLIFYCRVIWINWYVLSQIL